MMQNVIKTTNLTKYYGKSLGVENINLEVHKGEIFGFLGPNGAGKTTTIRLLLRLLIPTKGEAKIFGKNVRTEYPDILRDVGYLPGELNLYGGMTGRRMLSFFGAFHNGDISASSGNFAKEIIDRLGCQIDTPFRKLSTGNKRKIGILLAVSHRPRLLMLDEPTAGLDPITQNEFYAILDELKERGTTIFFSSHNLPEVERTCDRVGIIKNGRLVQVESVEELKRHRKKKVRVQYESDTLNVADLKAVETVEILEHQNGSLAFYVEGNHIGKVIKVLGATNVIDVDIAYPDLEQVFIKYYQS